MTHKFTPQVVRVTGRSALWLQGTVKVENSSAVEITVVAFGSGQVPGKSIGVVV